jgi:exonuclease V gamma subunit
MPDPYFDFKDAEGITNRITLTTLQSYLSNAKDEAKFNTNYKLTPELAVIFNQYFKSVKPQ